MTTNEAQPTDARDNLAIGAYVACGLILVGSLGPWGTVFGLSVAGTDGDGVGTLVLALLGAATVYLTTSSTSGKPKFKAHWLTVVIAVLVVLIAVVDIVDISSSEAVSPGWGIWLVLIAGGGLAVAGIQLLRRLKN